jgi:hypothetical protein
MLENDRYQDMFFYHPLGRRIDPMTSDFVTSTLLLGEDSV